MHSLTYRASLGKINYMTKVKGGVLKTELYFSIADTSVAQKLDVHWDNELFFPKALGKLVIFASTVNGCY